MKSRWVMPNNKMIKTKLPFTIAWLMIFAMSLTFTSSLSASSVTTKAREIKRDLAAFEQELLAATPNQVNVFLAIDEGDFFSVNSLNVQLNKQPIAKIRYSPLQANALSKGAVHPLYSNDTLPPGNYQLIAEIQGLDSQKSSFRRRITHDFVKKKNKPVFIELKVKNQLKRLKPEFIIQQW